MASVSIVESNPGFGDVIHYTFVYDQALKANQALLVKVECTQGGALVCAGFALPARGDFDFTLGPTPSWSGGGANGKLLLIVSTGGRFKTVATDTFSVAP